MWQQSAEAWTDDRLTTSFWSSNTCHLCCLVTVDCSAGWNCWRFTQHWEHGLVQHRGGVRHCRRSGHLHWQGNTQCYEHIKGQHEGLSADDGIVCWQTHVCFAMKLSNDCVCLSYSQVCREMNWVASWFSSKSFCVQRTVSVDIIIRPCRSRSTAAYSRQTFPMDDLSVRTCVGRSVGLFFCRSVQCIVEKRQIGSGCRLAS